MATETNEINSYGEQNVGVTSPPRNRTSLFGVRIGPPSRVTEVRQTDTLSQQKNSQENGIAFGAITPYSIGSSGVIAKQADQSPQQSITQLNEINRVNVATEELDEVTGSRKQAKVRTLDTEYGISLEVLEQHSGKKLEDVAAILQVSRSTLKRICRKHGIYRWPPFKAKRYNHQEFFQASYSSTEDSSQTKPPVPVLKDSTSQMQTTAEAKLMQDGDSIMVKATYKDDIIKFRLLLESRKLDLEKEVAMRLNLSVGTFRIKYLDEDGDWILISCDADLRTCISTLASLGKTTIRMSIDQRPSHNSRSG